MEDSDAFIVNGRKCFIASSHVATVHGLVAQTRLGQPENALTAYTCKRSDENRSADFRLISGKNIATEESVAATSEAVAMLGARGRIEEHSVEGSVHDALLTLEPAGTPDIQRKRLAGYRSFHLYEE